MTSIEVDPLDPKSITVGSTRWRLWQSDSGVRYATRGGSLTDEQMRLGCAMTLDADSSEELNRRLLAQPDVPAEDVDS